MAIKKTVTNNDIARVIYLYTKDKTGTHLKDSLQNVTKFLVRQRLLSKSKEILELLNKIINKEEGIVSAKVSSVEKLNSKTSEGLIHFLKKRYEAKDVVFEEKLDSGLLGGLRVEVNDEVMDLTMKNKIGQLQEYLKRI